MRTLGTAPWHAEERSLISEPDFLSIQVRFGLVLSYISMYGRMGVIDYQCKAELAIWTSVRHTHDYAAPHDALQGQTGLEYTYSADLRQ